MTTAAPPEKMSGEALAKYLEQLSRASVEPHTGILREAARRLSALPKGQDDEG